MDEIINGIAKAKVEEDLNDLYRAYLYAEKKGEKSKLSREEFVSMCGQILRESDIFYLDFYHQLVCSKYDIEGLAKISKMCSRKGFKMPLCAIDSGVFRAFNGDTHLLSRVIAYIDKFYAEKVVTGKLHLEDLITQKNRVLTNVDAWMRREENYYRNHVKMWEFYLFGADEFEGGKPKMLPRENYASDEEFSAEVERCLDALARQKSFKDASEAVLADHLSLAKRGSYPRLVKIFKSHFGVDLSGEERSEWDKIIQKNIAEYAPKPYEKLLPDCHERKRKQTPSESV